MNGHTRQWRIVLAVVLSCLVAAGALLRGLGLQTLAGAARPGAAAPRAGWVASRLRGTVGTPLALLLFGGLAAATLGVHAQEPVQTLSLNDWFTSVTFQNRDALTPATVSIAAYAGGGATSPPITPEQVVSIDPGANAIFLPGLNDAEGFIDLTLPASFLGGFSVSASQSVVAVTQIGNNSVGSFGNASGGAIGQYRSPTTFATELVYPVVKNGLGNKLTFFSIQAVQGDVVYLATIVANDSTVYTKTGSIDQHRTALLFPGTFSRGGLPGTNCGATSDPTFLDTSPCIGALTVVRIGGTGELVGAMIETRIDTALQNVAQAATLFPDSAGATTIYCPVVKHGAGANQNTSGVTIQNLGPDQVTVQMQTVLQVGGTSTATLTIPAAAARTLFATTLGFDAGPQQFGAAMLSVTAGTGPIIAAVNEANMQEPLHRQKQVAYTCFSAADASDNLAFPLVKERYGHPPAATSINLQNVGSSLTTLTVVYACGEAGQWTIPNIELAAGTGRTLFLTSSSPVNGTSVPTNAKCAVTVDAVPAESQIIGYAQDTSDLGFLSDGVVSHLDLRNYEGFTRP